VQTLHLSPEDLGHPESLIHQSLSGLDGHEVLALSEEEGQTAGDVFA
jgi:hypothetical protein